MKLCEYVLNGVPVSTHDTYSHGDLAGNDTVIISETTPLGYQDITSIQSWWEKGGNLGKDYKWIRYQMMVIAATQGFANLTESEKLIAARNFCVAKADRDTVMTIEEQIRYGVEFHKRSTEARHERRLHVEAEAYSRLGGTDKADLLADVTTLLDLYENFGLEGEVQGDDEGLFDYIEETPSTSFFGNGLKSKAYTIEGFTNTTDFANYLMTILRDGEY